MVRKHIQKYQSHWVSILFVVGLLVAFFASFFKVGPETQRVLFGILMFIGLVVGFFNITSKEAVPFLVGVIALMSMYPPFVSGLAQTFGLQNEGLRILGTLYNYLAALVVPAGFLVALRTFVMTAQDE